jgi:hypothetical protein
MFTLKKGLGLDFIDQVKQAMPSQVWRDGIRKTGYKTASAVDCSELQQLREHCLVHLEPNWTHSDCILIHYPNGSWCPKHKDVLLTGGEDNIHTRVLIMIQQPESGGELFIEDVLVPLEVGDAVIFRPCEVEHHVTPVVGERLMFGVGVWHPR